MKKRTLKHPRKVNWVMRDFVNEIHSLTYTAIKHTKKQEECADAWEWLNSIEWMELPATCKMVKVNQASFCAFVSDYEKNETVQFRIGYNLDHLMTKCQFCSNFRSRCSRAKGFADVTLILLHELGHFEAYEEYNEEEYCRRKAIDEIRKTSSTLEEANEKYFKLPEEIAATEWAINWLSNAENRKTAKKFEKKFFACFE